MAENNQKTITLTMSQEQFDSMERLAQKQGISMRDYFRQAMQVAQIVVGAKVDGEKVIFKNGNSYRELTLAG